MSNITEIVQKEVIEFSKNHYTTIILDPKLVDILQALVVVDTQNITIRRENNTVFYDVVLNEIDIDVIRYPCAYKVSSIYAAECLRCLLGEQSCSYLADFLIFPQVEWYVKNKTTNEVVDMSNPFMFNGGHYCLMNPRKFTTFGDILTYKESNHIYTSRTNKTPTFSCLYRETLSPNVVSIYGKQWYSHSPLYLFYGLCDREFTIKKSVKELSYMPIHSLLFESKSPYIKQDITHICNTYEYITDKHGTPKIALLGEYITNER